MRPAVRERWIGFTEPLEGSVRWLYADVRGLITIGLGCLVDPIEMALPLPFVRPDGSFATRDEIIIAWRIIKSRQELAQQGHRAAAQWTTLRLTDEGVAHLAHARLDDMERHLVQRFPQWDTFPADAQFAVLSMAWACGPAFAFPRCEAAILAQDWTEAARECRIDETGNPGLKPRNLANRILFQNAARVVADGRDPAELYWPDVLEAGIPTLPELPAAEDATGPGAVVHAAVEFPPRKYEG